jgi:hypothetical protein
MNRKILPAAVIAAVGATLSPGQAWATNVPTNPGDLILGFEASGSSNDLEVDIGPYSQFLNATVPFQVTFGVVPGSSTVVNNLYSDLSSDFGASGAWVSNTSLLWGVVGFLSNEPASNSYDIFETQDAHDTDPIENPGYSGTRSDETPLNSVLSGLSSSANDGFSTEAASISTGNANSWTSQGLSGVEQQDGDPAIGSTLNLFDLVPPGSSPNGSDAADIGSFSLNSSGDLIFTPTAVPEPATWLSIIGGGLLLGLFRRRRSTPVS